MLWPQHSHPVLSCSETHNERVGLNLEEVEDFNRQMKQMLKNTIVTAVSLLGTRCGSPLSLSNHKYSFFLVTIKNVLCLQ